MKVKKSNSKDRRINLYRNEPESSINLVAFTINICFPVFLQVCKKDNFNQVK